MARRVPVRRDFDSALLKFHIEPNTPLEVSELTAALGSLSRQYERFAVQEGMADRAHDARLLIANVAPGSIIVNFIPDWSTVAAVAAPLVSGAFHQAELVLKFAKRIEQVLDFFLEEKKSPGSHNVTIRDCDDAANIVGPIAQHGGKQTFVTINGGVQQNILTINAADALKIVENAGKAKAELLTVEGAKKAERVAMVWKQLARDAAKTGGKKSPDRGIIAEIDAKDHPVFFTDAMSGLKAEMIDNEDNPYKKVFFVDVEISRVPSGAVGNYRITAYHGSDDYEPPTQGTPLLSV